MKRTLYLCPHPYHQARGWAGAPVVTPNARAAEALGAPPVSLETLARETLLQSGVGLASPMLSQKLLQRAVEEVLGAGDPQGLAALYGPTLRELLRSGAGAEALERSGEARARRVGGVLRQYRDRLAGRGLIDPAEALWAAARLLEASGPAGRRPLRVAGYARLGLGERAFIEALAGEGSEVLLPWRATPLFRENEETAGRLVSDGWRLEKLEDEPLAIGERLGVRFTSRPPGTQPEPLPPLGEGAAAHVYPDQESEVRGVLAQVKGLLAGGVSPSDIALVTRDDAFYGPSVLAVAWEFGLPVRALYAVPLTETRLGGWLQLLIEAVREGFPFETTARLLAHALGPGLWGDAWRKARAGHPAGAAAWKRAGVELDSFHIGRHTESRSEHVEHLRGLLQSQQIRRRTGRWAREVLAYHALQGGLDELASPAAEKLSFEEFSRELLRMLALLTVPAQPGRGGVELHTPLSLYGARYRYLFVLGLAEGALPVPVRDDPCLDFHARRELAREGVPLEGAAEAARREELSFYAMLQAAAEEVAFSYPRRLGERDALASPYFSRLGLRPEAAACRLAASPEEVRAYALRAPAPTVEDHLLPAARSAWTIERRREDEGAPDEFDGIPGLPLDPDDRVFSASQLTSLGQCPFKWFARYVLDLKEPEEADDELTPAWRGKLYHQALRRAVEKGQGTEPFRQAVRDALEEMLLVAEQEVELPPLVAWEARRAECLEELRRAVDGEQFIGAGCRVVATERAFTGTWRGLRVEGRVDRVDEGPAGLLFVDYKSSGSKPAGAQNEEGKADLDLQLPIYVEAGGPALFPEAPVAGAYYYSFSGAKKLAEAKPDQAALQQFVERVRRHLVAGSYPVRPDLDQTACRYCDFDPVCRRGPRLARKAGAG